MSITRRSVAGSRKRALVALAMGAIASPLAIGITAGSASAAVDISTACPEDAFEDAGFTDIGGQNEQFQLAINCLAAIGITTGTTPTTFTPNADISRVQMAQFLFRLGEAVGVEWDTATLAPFSDIAGLSDEGRLAVTALFNAGVVNGRTETTYEPLSVVRRDQMASFLVQFHDAVFETTPLPGTVTDAFTDDETSVHEDNINVLAAADITDGVAAGRYAPSRSVSRAQMAAFVTRHIQVLVNEGLVPPPFGAEVQVELTTEGDINAGDTIEGVFTNLPENVASVTATGAGLTDEPVAVDAAGAFTLTLPADLADGPQEVVFTITLDDGTTVEAMLAFEVVSPTPPPAEDTTAPVITAEASGTTATFTSDDVLSAASVESGDVTTDSTTATITTVELDETGQVITVTLDAAPGDGETVTLAADSVLNVDGLAGPEADVVATFTTTTDAAPVALSARFVDEPTDADTVFGDEAFDQIRLALDEVVTVPAGATVTVDPDGAGAAAAVTLTCGTNIRCTANTATGPVLLESTSTTPDVPITPGTSQVTDTAGMTDDAGQDVTGFPVAISSR